MSDDIAASSTFKVDYAASGRSKCQRCRSAIDERELRIGPMVQSDKGDFKYPQWHHFHCFEDGWLKKNPGALCDVKAVSGVDQLQFADQKKIKSLVVGGDSSLETKAVTAEEKRLAQESKLMWNRKEKLESLSNAELADVLEHNHQPHSGKIFGGRLKMIERVSDGMVFGALPKCSVCHNGDFYFSHGEYKCTGAADEFAKCEHRCKDVVRTPFTIPAHVAQAHKFLETFRFKQRDRLTDVLEASTNPMAVATAPSNPIVVPSATGADVGATVGDGAAEGDEGVSDSQRKRPRDDVAVGATLEHLKPFQGTVVMFAGKLSKTQPELEKLITANGGIVAKSASSATVCVCTPQEATGNGSKKGRDAVAAGVLCVGEQWIYDSIAAGSRLAAAQLTSLILANPIKADASRDALKTLGDKYELERVAQEQRALLEEKHTEAPGGKKSLRDPMKKVVVKGGCAVEPDSELVDEGHIYESHGDIFSSIMNNTDVVTGKNGFYILQIIEHDNKKKWTVFRKWGKLGDDTIGGKKSTDYPLPAAAEREFKKTFKDKTGNDWEQRKNFKKQYGKFMPIEIDYSDDAPAGSSSPAGGGSLTNAGYQGSLAPATQDFVRLIFDIKAMNDALKEMEIDTQKLPLGKLSKNTIQEGFKALRDLQTVVSSGAEINGATKTQVVSLTNKFYNYIPHIAPPTGLPLLDDLEKIKAKSELLSALQDLEIASKMVSADSSNAAEHPIDTHYKKLRTRLDVVDKTSDVFARINEYIQNTHGHTHTTYALELVDLWEVNREGEEEKFAPHAQNKNRMLLWHGSRLTNWGGILSQGLRIAPPEAPSTGYMFGKGVYFADMASKSANYCFTSSDKTTGILMLCEVALGDMKEYKHAFYVDGLPKPFQSTKGVGKYAPDSKESYTEPNGCVIPKGHGAKSGVEDTTLLYNEFIVYDVSQIRTRYVMRMNFKYSKKAGTFF